MAVDMRARYFGEFDEGAMPSSFGVLPQAVPQPSAFEVMPTSGAAPIMDTPRKAAVMPTTTEAVAPNYLSGLNLSDADLASLYALSANNAGGSTPSGIAGLPSLGAGYVPQFEEKLITAPVSNKGNATAYSGMDNQFYMSPNDFVRLVDRGTNTVVFEGTGYEAAQKAVEMGQNLTDTMGRKADYKIETGKTQDTYAPVASEKYNKSDLSKIANVAGTVLPLAMMAVPGLNVAAGKLLGSQLLGSIALGAGTGGLSAGLKGDNILKGAALGGLTAAGGALIPKIQVIGDLGDLAKPIGTAVGSTVGNLATGQNLRNSLLSGAATGALTYAAPSIQDAFKGTGPNVSAGSTGANAASGPAPIATVTGNTGVSAPVSFGGGSSPQTKVAELEPPATIVSGSGSPFAAAFPIPSNVLSMAQPKPAADQMSEEDLIKVTGERLDAVSPNISIPTSDARGPLSSVVDGVDTATREIVAEGNRFRTVTPNVVIPDSALSPEVLRAINKPAEEPLIKVTGRQTTTPPVLWGVETPLPDLSKTNAEEQAKEDEERKKLDASDYLRLASLAAGLIGSGGGGGGGGGAAGSQAINPIFSAKLPTPGAGGAFKVGGLDYTTPPARSAADMYRYAMGPAMDIPAGMDLRGATSPYAGYGPGTLGEETFKRVAGTAPTRTIIGQGSRLVDGRRVPYNIYDDGTTDPFVIPDRLRTTAPITTPVPNNPAGPIMAEEPPRFAEGGAFAAKGYARGSSRDSFAVQGPGTGRSDDIPAVLSDGEYVIDAETVALLGDGSSKAGAKKLDEMRVKVRKHKGRNLAKGKFSVNAKRPEKYLSGGRT
jgi:hypothetical protein